MTNKFYFPLIAVALLLAMGWLVQVFFVHTPGSALILQTTNDDELKQIKSELKFIASHRADMNFAAQKGTHSLSSLHKVSLDSFVMDSSQIKDAKDLSVTWATWKVRQLNAQLLLEPVYIVQANASDSSHR